MKPTVGRIVHYTNLGDKEGLNEAIAAWNERKPSQTATEKEK